MPMFYRERGLHDLNADDPMRADALEFGPYVETPVNAL
jgi:hypothetical protein